jgi:hypothetical protein
MQTDMNADGRLDIQNLWNQIGKPLLNFLIAFLKQKTYEKILWFFLFVLSYLI